MKLPLFTTIHHNELRHIKRLPLLAITAFAIFSAHNAAAQTWNYRSYYNGQPAAPGSVTLSENGGKPSLRMVFSYASICYRGDLDATVERNDTITIITVPPHLRGCDEFRLVIKNDGTGGLREMKKGSAWVWDGAERGLTIRK